MKKNLFFIAAVAAAVFAFSSCSNLFEQFADDDGTVKTGDDSLSAVAGNTDIDNGLVVIKNTATTYNQITYTTDSTGSIQKNYFVGTLPMSSTDYIAAIGSTIVPDYTNGTTTCLTGKDNPVVLKCIPNDTHAKITWSAKQIYKYTPQTAVYTTTDADGNAVTYTGIKSVDGATIASADQPSVSFTLQNNEGTIIESNLPYGVTVVTAVVTADDGEYNTTYTITLTKKYTLTIAGQEDSNNVTTSGLVVIKQTMPSTNQIQFDPLTYSYTIGDPDKVTVKATDDTTGNLTGKDDPVSLKCYIPDTDATITWTAKQTKTFTPNYTTYNTTDSSGNAVTYKGISSETLTALTTPVSFDVISAATSAGTNPYLLVDQTTTQMNQIVTSDLPYGVTVVTCTVTGYDDDGSGTVKAYTSVYTITLVKQYIITTATAGTASSLAELTSGLVVIKSSAPAKNQITYSPTTTTYSVLDLTGKDDSAEFRCYPDDTYHTSLTWTAKQTQTIEYTTTAKQDEYNTEYTLLSSQQYKDITPVDLTLTAGSSNNIQTVDLPYGTTVVTATVSSNYEASGTKVLTVYTITLQKKHTSTKVNITTTNGDVISNVVDSGLVVLKNNTTDVNCITFSSNTANYYVTGLKEDDSPVSIFCFLTDTDASVSWKAVQTSYDKYTSVSKKTTVSTPQGDQVVTITTYVDELVTLSKAADLSTNTTYYSKDGTLVDNGDLYKADDIKDIGGTEYGNQKISIDIPFGVTVITATVVSDDATYPQTVYTITLTKRYASSDISTSSTTKGILNGLTVTPKSTTGDDPKGYFTNTSGKTVTFNSNSYVYIYKTDESTDSLNFVPDGGTDSTYTVSENVKGGTAVPICTNVAYNAIPEIPIVGDGETSTEIDITITNSEGKTQTYYIFTDPSDCGDTSLKTLTDTVTAATVASSSYDKASGLTALNLSTTADGTDDITADCTSKATPASGQYYITAGSDNRVDVESIEYAAIPNALYTKLECYVGTYNEFAANKTATTGWTTLYNYVKSGDASNVSNGTKSITLVNTAAENKQTLWIRATSKAYLHRLSDIKKDSNGKITVTKTSDVRYHEVTVLKYGDNYNTTTASGTGTYGIMSYEIDAEYEQGKASLGEAVQSKMLTTTPGTIYSPSATATQSINTYADKLTFYFRLVDINATSPLHTISYSITSGDTTTPTNSGDVTTKALGTDGLEYYTFSIGETSTTADLPDKDFPDGTSTVTITEAGVTIGTFTIIKPDAQAAGFDNAITGIRSGGGTGTGDGRTYYKYYIGSDIETVDLTLSTTSSDESITIESCQYAYSGDVNVTTAVESPTDVVYTVDAKTYSEDTAPTGSYTATGVTGKNTVTGATVYTLSLGSSGTNKLVQGTTYVKLTVTAPSTSTSNDYGFYIVKLASTETRLSAFTFDEETPSYTKDSTVTEWTMNDDSSTTPYYMTGTNATVTDASTLSATPYDTAAGVSLARIRSTSVIADDDLEKQEWPTSGDDYVVGDAGSEAQLSTGAFANGYWYVYFKITVTAASSDTRTYYAKKIATPSVLCALTNMSVTQALSSTVTSTYDQLYSGKSFTASTSTENTAGATSARYVGPLVFTPTYSSKATVTPTVESDSGSYTVNTDYTFSSSTGIVTIPYETYKSATWIKVTLLVTAEDQEHTGTYIFKTTVGNWVATDASTIQKQTIPAALTYNKKDDTVKYTVPYNKSYKKRLAYRFGSYRTDGPYKLLETQSYKGIDIIGTLDSTATTPVWGATAYTLSGWIYGISIDGGDTKYLDLSTGSATIDPDNDSSTDNSVTVSFGEPTVRYDGSATDATPYMTLPLTITSAASHTVKIGAMIDTFVDTLANASSHSDGVSVVTTGYGFYMKNNGYKFDVYLKNTTGVDDVSTFWYGSYSSSGNEAQYLFTSGNETYSDSAVCYSWNLGTIAASGSVTKTIMMSIGSAQ